ncbi:MAG: iron-sulfur cluster assembly scaffold protein, partial [Desulfobacterales bacterium]
MKPMNFNFLQGHSNHYLEMAFRTDRCERVERADGHGKRTGDCGDTVEIYLSINQGCIRAVSF